MPTVTRGEWDEWLVAARLHLGRSQEDYHTDRHTKGKVWRLIKKYSNRQGRHALATPGVDLHIKRHVARAMHDKLRDEGHRNYGG
eukprot:COSAG04_NODE_23345_length_340_cov_0.647303_1_plen_84_part_10